MLKAFFYELLGYGSDFKVIVDEWRELQPRWQVFWAIGAGATLMLVIGIIMAAWGMK